MLYTRKGDSGTSRLFNSEERVPKNSLVYEALGSLDELNSLLGVCRAYATRIRGEIDIAGEVKNVQEYLFIVQAELAGAEKSISQAHVDELEDVIDRVEQLIERPRTFVVPGETDLSALFDYARAVSRRSERAVIATVLIRNVSHETCAYLNRLSSLLYALARYTAAKEGARELTPLY